jgi:hypothetical protein
MIQMELFGVTLWHYDYSIAKDWYLEFYVSGKRKRVKDGSNYGLHGNGNSYTTKTLRLLFFARLQAAVIEFYADIFFNNNPIVFLKVNK